MTEAIKHHLQSAEKLVQKGAHKKAIAELKKLLKKEPENVRALTRMGDVYVELGEMELAREAYVKVGDFYKREGYLLKAISMYKALVERLPEDADLLITLGDLFRQMGLFSDAVIRYRNSVDLLHKAHRVLDKLHVVRRILDLNPDNVVDRVKLAESYVKLHQMEDAREQLRIAGNELFRRGEGEAFIQVAERFLHFQADDVEMNRRLAEVYAQKKNYLKALEKLQVCLELKPQARDVLEMIARLFVELGEREKALFVLQELSRLATRDGLAAEKERCERLIARLGGGESARAPDGGIPTGQEVEFEDFSEVTVVEDTGEGFAELPIDDEEHHAPSVPVLSAVESGPAPESSMDDLGIEDIGFDSSEFEDTIVVEGMEPQELEGLAEREGVDLSLLAGREPAAPSQEPPRLPADAHVEDAAIAEMAGELGGERTPGAVEVHEGEEGLPLSVQAELREFEFYLNNKLYEEAEEVLAELRDRYPRAKFVKEKQKQLEALR
jgi:tetratricopeptide (TPR) repeat protein